MLTYDSLAFVQETFVFWTILALGSTLIAAHPETRLPRRVGGLGSLVVTAERNSVGTLTPTMEMMEPRRRDSVVRGISFHGIGGPQRALESDEARYWITVDAFHGILDSLAGKISTLYG